MNVYMGSAKTADQPARGERLAFDLDMFRKECLLQGLDDIGLTLDKAGLIRDYEERSREKFPWLFADLS